MFVQDVHETRNIVTLSHDHREEEHTAATKVNILFFQRYYRNKLQINDMPNKEECTNFFSSGGWALLILISCDFQNKFNGR